MRATKRFALDVIERAAATFVEAFAATFLASELNLWTRVQISFGAAAAAVLKAFTSKNVGAKGTAALLPVTADAASAVLDGTGRVVGVLTEPVPVAKQVGDAVEDGIDTVTDKVQDAAASGARTVDSFLSRLVNRRRNQRT